MAARGCRSRADLRRRPRPGGDAEAARPVGAARRPGALLLPRPECRRHPDLVRRTVGEGHVVGSHSWSHPHPAQVNALELLRDYRRGHATLRGIMHRADLPFRPPHGFLSPSTAIAVRALATDCWLWSVDPEDWRPG